MSPERWRPFSSEPGPDDYQYWLQQDSRMTPADARKTAFWYQSISATEMWEHLQYLEAGRADESPYYQTRDIAGDQERLTMAPLLLTFVNLVRSNHPNIPETQLRESIRAAMYDPGVLDLIQLINNSD